MPYNHGMALSTVENILEVSTDEIRLLRKAVKDSNLNDRFKAVIFTMIEEIVQAKQTEKEKQASLKRIKRMFSSSTEKQQKSKTPVESEKPTKNHGRYSTNDYQFSQIVTYPSDLPPGARCPGCDHGTLQPLEARKIIKLTGSSLVSAELHQPERLRCSGCGEIITAAMPEGLTEEKADASANATVAILRYGMGVPHYRLAKMQKAMGVPLPPSNQYEMVEMLWTQVIPVYNELLKQAADSTLMFVDDTTNRILSMMKNKQERKSAGERVGIFTTGIVAKKHGQEIQLYFTGGKHAGENLSELLKLRDGTLPPPMQMCDALSRNVCKDHLTILILCLVHGRRNFVDCSESFPDESTYVIERIAEVYKNEGLIMSAGMDVQQRLEYHQQNSQVPMQEILDYAKQKLESKEVEHNSTLGDAFKYMIKHWTGMTQFLRIAGAPLDNNLAERTLKKSILHRKNSMFYKNENGARVGDVLMSVIFTAMAAMVNPYDYLISIQRHSKAVAKNPQLWLPWNYKKMLPGTGNAHNQANAPP